MALIDILEQKARQYGVGLTTAPETEAIDANWFSIKKKVDELPSSFENVFAEWIDEYLDKGIIEDKRFESREKSGKFVKNTSDLKYWGVLKSESKRSSLIAPYLIFDNYEIELIVYQSKDGSLKEAAYAVYDPANNRCYKRIIN